MDKLRSATWWEAPGKSGFIARHHMRQLGLTAEQLRDRPVVGICNSWSELTPCNAHLRTLAESVRRGITAAGGLALEFPTMSIGEPLMRPTSMLFRNLMSMDVEETIRANPLDAVVLLGGCDKTLPAQIMGAVSVDLPAIALSGGPMLSGRFRGHTVGSGTDIWRMSEDLRAGRVSQEDFDEFEGCLARSAGHCMTMGTASTMSGLAEALGLSLPGAAALPAVDARRAQLAEQTGARAVELAREGLRPSDLLTEAAFGNAVVTNAAIGGSTNAVLHLLAIAGRAGLPIALADFDEIGSQVPLLADLMPSGRFLMEDFAYAGGMPALMAELGDLLDTEVLTVTGRTLGENLKGAQVWNREVIRPLTDPVQPAGSGTAVLRGNLAPDGAVVKQSAASPELLRHRGPALVFDSIEEYVRAADDPDLAVTADSVLVVRNLGPRGYPGMPELGNLPLPAKLLAEGVTDMVRVSDARMSGTAYGTVVLHVAPEAAAGGPLALVRTGDTVELDVPARTLRLDVPDEELAARRNAWTPPSPPQERGWVRLYTDHVQQADRGADLDFLVGGSGDRPAKAPF
ncbi:dihydroxy-acid dehydratase (plasmid) [Streptomyces sp. NBC_00841]|uniref:IlvD/Edd family dehydratase n=1 Tax=unclassified Streptomyces TaxID=2593676 RepID=UPI002253BC91|nr:MULTISPECIES: IlvD/Edd family dehydratase [unclassified Streptomyces]MCX4538825.1 dihydroxy-acid dehydratase [Streptomyces sp. NBC_01669]WSA05380.1 dihydroxy-acid dehydratase [Streptomyces sp. NBC_00841]